VRAGQANDDIDPDLEEVDVLMYSSYSSYSISMINEIGAAVVVCRTCPFPMLNSLLLLHTTPMEQQTMRDSIPSWLLPLQTNSTHCRATALPHLRLSSSTPMCDRILD
jgi:hypothetical protein